MPTTSNFKGTKYDPGMISTDLMEKVAFNMGFASRVAVIRPNEGAITGQGSTVTVTVPGIITASRDPLAANQTIRSSTRSFQVNNWVSVPLEMNDIDIAYAGDSSALMEHLDIAADAVVADINKEFPSLYKRIGNRIAHTAASIRSDLTGINKALIKQGVPSREPVTWMVDTENYARLLGSNEYPIVNTSTGQANDIVNPNDRSLRELLNITPHVMQDSSFLVKFTCGTIATQALPVPGALSGIHGVNATSLTIAGLTPGLTIVDGDVLNIAGIPYPFTATAGVTTAATTVVSIYPPLPADMPASTGIAFARSPTGTQIYYANVAFTQKAFCMVSVDLPMDAGEWGGGVNQFTARHPDLPFYLRMSLNYDSSGYGKKMAKIDGLFGATVMDPARAVLICRKDPDVTVV